MSLSIHFPQYPCSNPVQMRAMCGECKLVIGRGELGQEPAAKLVLSLSGFIIITTLIHWIPGPRTNGMSWTRPGNNPFKVLINLIIPV